MPTLFPTDAPEHQWETFAAEGYPHPACGVVYRLADTVTNGMALGGVDTGCLDLETTATWGYCTVFDTHVPRRGPLGSALLWVARLREDSGDLAGAAVALRQALEREPDCAEARARLAELGG